MSISNEQAEQLIYGYLDDTLNESELAEFQHYRSEDREFAVLLTQLRRRRDALEQIAGESSSVRLPENFAQRVVEAAVARAREEGLAEDHPLNLVAEQPFVRPYSSEQRFWNRRTATVAASVAASFALVMWSANQWSTNQWSGRHTAGSSQTVAQDDTTTLGHSVDGDETPSTNGKQTLIDRNVSSEAFIDTEINSPKPIANRPDKTERSDKAKLSGDSLESTLHDSMSPELAIASTAPARNGVGVNNRDVNDSLASVTPSQGAWRVPAVLVLNIKQTEQGRENRAVIRALQQADITDQSQRAVNEELSLTATQAADVDENDQGTIMYLVAPGKNVDRFYLRLLSDQQGVESVSMSLSMDAPVLEAVSKVVDPTAVRHGSPQTGAVVDWIGQDDSPDATRLVEAIDQLHFSEMNRSQMGMHAGSSADVTVSVLVVVR